MENNLKTEIFSYFKQMQTVFFATCDEEHPYVRPMLLLYVDKKFWVATGANDAKTPQLKNNPHFEFCYFIEKEQDHGYIRGSGVVEFIADLNLRKKFIDNFGYIRHYWQKPDDPNYMLLQCMIKNFEFMRPGENTSDKLEL